MINITHEEKIKVVAEDILESMTEKELHAFAIWQISASLRQLDEADVDGMWKEILSEIQYG